MNEGIVSIIMSVVAFFGIAITGYFTYKSTKATAQIDQLNKRIFDLEAENKLLMKLIKDCQENKADK